MPKVAVYNMEGKAVGEIELSAEVFGIEPNQSALHTVVRAQLNNKRRGTKSTLTRTEVQCSRRKVYRQKGTGRARHGAASAPQFVKGGVVFAPKPRDFSMTVPRKLRRLALKSALSAKVLDNDMIVIDSLTLSQPKTREMAKVLKALAAEKKALLVLDSADEAVLRASANIPGLKTAYVNTINVLDILGYTKFIVVKNAVDQIQEVYA
ncbi:MAG: 50S ribosomal protein L4 [Firmicutes bacterium ADurb.Bin356]|nr:MAG: 50S ribosomal protein L4 [Firmicutes bacterium ADurb.Bin356]